MDYVTKVLLVLFGYITLFYGVRAFHNDPLCGQNDYRNSRIIGGEGVKIAEFPWYVSIKETGQHSCSGFIISNKAVISAAHCFKDFSKRALASPKTISVTLGLHYLNRRKLKKASDGRPRSRWEQNVKVKRIIRHPQYNPFNDSGKHDIALLVLETEIHWNDGTKPVCLPGLSNSSGSHIASNLYPSLLNDSITRRLKLFNDEFHSGEEAIVAGWGSTDSSGMNGESILQKVRLTVYSNEECKKILMEKNVKTKTDIDSSVICAGSNDVGFDSCSGDSGSALLVQKDNSWVAIAIVSGGFGECGGGLPGLYTRISSYLDFIRLLDS